MAKKKLTLEDMLVPKEEIPYEVPENWCWVKYDSIIENLSSSTKKIKQKEYLQEGLFPIIDQGSDLIGGYTNDEELLYDGELPVIIFGDHTRCVKYIDFKFAQGADGVKVLKPKASINSKYIYYLMLNLQLPNKGYSRHYKFLREAKFQIPPLAEQERIVKRIESLFEKVDKAAGLVDEARDGFEKRRAAILEKAFSGELTAKWREDKGIKFNKEKIALSQVISVNPKKTKLEVDDEQICSFVPMVAVSDVNGKIESMEERPYSKVKKGYTYFEEDDVLFAKITPCMENGKSCIAEGLSNGFGFGTTEFHVLRCSEKVLNKYIYYLVRAKWFREEAKQHMTGAVGQQRVPKTYIEEYEVWIPSIDEQKEVVRLLECMLDKEFEIEYLCDIDYKVELLKKSILGRAFRGELGSNDIDEKSSIELLKSLI